MRWFLLSLTLASACGGNGDADLGATNVATASCPISSSYEVDERFRITAAALSSKESTLAVTLSNELGDTVTTKTLVIVRRTNGSCTPPTGNRVASVLDPESTDVITGAAFPSTVASPPVESQTSAITLAVTGTTTMARQIRTPDFTLPVGR